MPEVDSLRTEAIIAGQSQSVTYIHFFGLKRSGNHALIGWLSEGLSRGQKGGVAHFNAVNEPRHPADPSKPYLDVDYMLSAIDRGRPRYVVVSYEDLMFAKRRLQEHYTTFTRSNCIDVLLLRNFPNLIASQIQRRRNVEARGETRNIHRLGLMDVRDVWVENAHAIVNMSEGDFAAILYDKWFQNKEYRDRVAIQLGFLNEDLGINQVSGIGEGSSFDGLTLQGRAQDMDVTDRWHLFARNRDAANLYASLVTPEVIELNLELFGYNPSPSSLLK